MIIPSERLIGYARVSTTEQELDLQIDALLSHGVEKRHLYCDKISGAKEDRPGLAACNEALRRGDTLVVWRLDRRGRSMRHLVNMIEDLKERGIGFRSISDGMIDTTSASGERPLDRDDPKVVLANKLFCDKSIGIDDICDTLKISRTTLYRYAKMHGNRNARS